MASLLGRARATGFARTFFTAARSDPYALLGVRPGASAAELKDAYRGMAMELHPDRNPGDAGAAEKFKALSKVCATHRFSLISLLN